MVVFALFFVALIITGTAFVCWLWNRLDPEDFAATPSLERVLAGSLVGVGGWIAFNWLLALTGSLIAWPLWGGVGVILALAALLVLRWFRVSGKHEVSNEQAMLLACLLPLLLWLIFIAWRGVVLPPASHDALAYHLPKAVMLERAQGWQVFPAPDPRITNYPFNYELLLADIFILSGRDTLTEWVGTATFLLTLLGAATLAQRWSAASLPAILATILATASAPVILLHSGADKNDLLVGWFALCALIWGSRWTARGGTMPFVLMSLGLAMGLGTKTTIVAVGAGLAPLLLMTSIRTIRAGRASARAAMLLSVGAIILIVLGGGFTFIASYLHVTAGGASTSLAQSATSVTTISWGDWNNLWQVPYLLVTIPFSSNPYGVWVPWTQSIWFWPHYEIYFSHYGRLISLLLLALPVLIWRSRERTTALAHEKRAFAIATVLAILLMLPTVFRPVGFFGALARYFIFVVPIVAAATVPPLVAMLERRSRRLLLAAVAALAVIFSGEAVVCAVSDRFAPVSYAVWASQRPGTRLIHFYPFRAGSLVDRLAGPSDAVAVDGAFDTWVYPAYGALRTRPVSFLPQDATGDTIPPHVRWVMIDRSWNALWANPKFEHMGQLGQFIGRGQASDADTRLLRLLRKDRRFQLIHYNPRMNQAIFRRVAS